MTTKQDPIGTVVQCHKCHKRLKYTGKKPYIVCPGCGERIPVVDNIQEGESIELPPPVQSSSSINGMNWDSKVEVGKIDFSKLGTNAESTVNSISQLLPSKPIPMHHAVIYCIWVLWVIVVFLSSLRTFTDFSQVSDGTVYTNNFGPRSTTEFLLVSFLASVTVAVFYAVFAAIPTFLIWNYFKLKSNDK